MIDVFVFENNGRRQIAIHSGYGAVWTIEAATDLHTALSVALLRALDPTPLPEPPPPPIGGARTLPYTPLEDLL